LLLDLKGVDTRLAPNLIEAMATLAPERRYAVSTRRWSLLEAFREYADVFVVHAAASASELQSVRDHLNWHDHHAVALDHRLLTPARVEELRTYAPALFAWTVNEEARMRQLVEWGVNGIISDRLDVLRAVLRMDAGRAR
jgi:glycerophosphoryl diester phosphodiesterase